MKNGCKVHLGWLIRACLTKKSLLSWDHFRSLDSGRCILGLWEKEDKDSRRIENDKAWNQKLSCCNLWKVYCSYTPEYVGINIYCICLVG